MFRKFCALLKIICQFWYKLFCQNILPLEFASYGNKLAIIQPMLKCWQWLPNLFTKKCRYLLKLSLQYFDDSYGQFNELSRSCCGVFLLLCLTEGFIIMSFSQIALVSDNCLATLYCRVDKRIITSAYVDLTVMLTGDITYTSRHIVRFTDPILFP